MSLTALVARVVGRGRRTREVTRITLAARRSNATVDLHVAPTARLGDIDVRFAPGTHNVLTVGEHSVLDDGVEIRLSGGELRIGEWVEVRGGVRLMVSGCFVAEGENVLSWGTVIHCAEMVTFERQATCAEYATVVDSVHEHVEGEWHADHVRTAPVRVGVETWVGAKATITPGVTIGAHCSVAGSAVVTHDVPDGHLAIGIPAACRPLPPPRKPR